MDQEEFNLKVKIGTLYQDGSRFVADVCNERTGEVVEVTARDRAGIERKALMQSHKWAKEWMLEKTQLALNIIKNNRELLQDGLVQVHQLHWNDLRRSDVFPGVKPQLKDFKKGSLVQSLRFLPFLSEAAQNEEQEEDIQYQKALDAYRKQYSDWQQEKDLYNEGIKKKCDLYSSGKAQGVEYYIRQVLMRIPYPKSLVIRNNVVFDENSKVLLVEIQLPSKQEISNIKEYRYTSTNQMIKQVCMSDKDYALYYNDVIYQIILLTIHVIFKNDYKKCIDTVVLNGNAELKDLAKGNTLNKTIATVSVGRQEFVTINLAEVDAEACFKGLKGISAGSLASLTPVKPIMQFDKRDRRIVQADEVIDNVSVKRNLATMPWMEFEVLIRDLMRREFSGEGVSVNVTRASRDAGVDAIVFDEDPIYGGKFVIQAKRYNNLVPVSAVRDLFGTVHNEGAVKGILVTTSYFGPDSIAFAKDKPLTLINGDQLLYMLNKHGYDFKIKLKQKSNQV